MSKSNQQLENIIDQQLCIGCGLCEAISPEKIAIEKSSNKYLIPVIKKDLNAEDISKIYQSCPSIRLRGLPKELIEKDSKINDIWGVWRQIVMAYASEKTVRHQGATGGVLTALSIYLLEQKKVAFIYHAKPGINDPSFGEAHISYNKESILQGAGSRYGPTAILKDIQIALAQEIPFAFIGKPCDISALRNYAKIDSRVNKYIKYWLTPICGGFLPPYKMDEFLIKNNIQPELVKKLSYRGNGCPGPVRVECKNGEVKNFTYIDMWGTDETQWSIPFRCKICPDGIGEAADIVSADSWIGGGPSEEEMKNDPGTNAVIARTKKGETLLQQAKEKGYLTIKYNINPGTLCLYQPHQVNKKYAAWGRFKGLETSGYIVPKTQGLRIKKLAKQLPKSFSEAQKQGTIKRINQST